MSWPCTDSSPPTPGVSRRHSPERSIRCGTRTSTVRTSPGRSSARSETSAARSSIRTSSSVSSSSPRPLEVRDRPERLAVPDEGGDAGDDVGVDRAAAVWSRALTSVLLPRLNSPTTATVTARCSTIVRTPASRSVRSGRSRPPARARLASSAATRSRTEAGPEGVGAGVVPAGRRLQWGPAPVQERAPGSPGSRRHPRWRVPLTTRGSGGSWHRRPHPPRWSGCSCCTGSSPSRRRSSPWGSHRAPQQCQASERTPARAATSTRGGGVPSGSKRGSGGDGGPVQRLRGTQSRGVGLLRVLRNLPRLGRARVADRPRRRTPPPPHPSSARPPRRSPHRRARRRPHPSRRSRLRCPRRRHPRPPVRRVPTAVRTTPRPVASAAGAGIRSWPRPRRPRRPARPPLPNGAGGTRRHEPRAGSTAGACRRSTGGVGCS